MKTKIPKLHSLTFFAIIFLLALPNHSKAQWSTSGNTGTNSDKLGTTNNDSFSIISNNTARIWVKANGNVGIGTSKTGTYLLSVDGKVRAKEIIVNNDTWADFVFASGY